MKKILFVCLGNICRSPMAEFMLKDMLKKKNIDNLFLVESRATCSEEIGNPVYYAAKEKLLEYNILAEGKTAKKLEKSDYDNFDYIIGMEESNIRDIIRIIGNDYDQKVYRLLDFSDNPRDISDPWYTRDFDKAYEDILEGLNSFLEKIGY
jgi:protein-tyrosine phosphatase